MKLLVVIGTRPEAIKMERLIVRLTRRSHFSIKVCNTIQHEYFLHLFLNYLVYNPIL